MNSDQGIEGPFGEPVRLTGSALYFTSWKYVRQGSFRYERSGTPTTAAIDPMAAALLTGDGPQPAPYRETDMPRGIRLRAQKAQRVPIEGGQLGFHPTVLYDRGMYRAWYGVDPSPDPEPGSTKDRILYTRNTHVAYAESSDGFHWQKPDLGLYEYGGSRANNIVLRNDLHGSERGWHGGSVFIDPTSAKERYKMVYQGGITDQEWAAFEKKYPGQINPTARRQPFAGYRLVSALFGSVSADGIHWENLPEPFLVDHCDTQNTCCYDVDRQIYVAYVRTWQVNRQAPGFAASFADSWIEVGRRSIGRAVSTDFRHFSRPEVLIATGADMAPNHLWYANCKTTLPGCVDNHVMFPWRWEMASDDGDCFLFSSADGWAWSQVPGGQVVERGVPGEADGGYVVCSPHLVELGGDRWALPVHAWPIPHKYPGRDLSTRTGLFPGVPESIGYATWPKGRLVAIECGDAGFFATVGIVPPSDKMRLNASIRPAGHIKVSAGILGAGPIAGRGFEDADPLTGDGLHMPVTWRGEEGLNHGGAPVVLRFQLRHAKLFGLEFV